MPCTKMLTLILLFSLSAKLSCFPTCIPADITFLVADLKYSSDKGVQICEIQSGSASVFFGYDYLHQTKGMAAKMFCDFISQYQKRAWFIPYGFSDRRFKAEFKCRGWKRIPKLKNLQDDINDLKIIYQPVKDPHNLYDYHGIVLACPYGSSCIDHLRDHPGILFCEAAAYPFAKNKLHMSRLMNNDEALKKMKPQWACYPTSYSPELVREILTNFQSEWLVIKPLNASRAFGVIIVEKDNLDEMLQYLFSDGDLPSSIYGDYGYKYWKKRKSSHFLIEEFAHSDPVNAPQFDNKPFDATMRVVFVLTYHLQKIEVTIMDSYWQLPTKSLIDEGTLEDRHISEGESNYFVHVSPEIMDKVSKQLIEGLPKLYIQMLNYSD